MYVHFFCFLSQKREKKREKTKFPIGMIHELPLPPFSTFSYGEVVLIIIVIIPPYASRIRTGLSAASLRSLRASSRTWRSRRWCLSIWGRRSVSSHFLFFFFFFYLPFPFLFPFFSGFSWGNFSLLLIFFSPFLFPLVLVDCVDMTAVEAVVDVNHRYKEIFYDSWVGTTAGMRVTCNMECNCVWVYPIA